MRVLKGGSRLTLAAPERGRLNMSTTGNQKKHSRSFLEATIHLQVRNNTWAFINYTNYSAFFFCFPDFQTCDAPPQASNQQPGVVKTQDPQIERDLHLSLEDLYLGCTKKIKISRRVGGKLRESRWRQAQKETFIFLLSPGYECGWICIQYQGQNPDNRCETWMERRHKSHFPQRRRSGENQKQTAPTSVQIQQCRNCDNIAN